MESFFHTFAVAACGFITSILTALAVTLIHNLIGLEVFTFSIWVIVPAGAIGCGLAAASGYYFGSLYFHKRPSKILILQMVLIAAFTQILIYYMEYSTLVLEDGARASDVVPFVRYMDIVLTAAHYSLGRGRIDVGEVGVLGYGLAVIQFIGFMIGGVSIYYILLGRLNCIKCGKYYRPLASKNKHFAITDDFAVYYDGIFKCPVDSDGFAAMLCNKYEASVQKGAVSLEEKLYGCPQCKQQLIINTVKVCNGDGWNEIGTLARNVLIPDGINLVELFKTP